MLYEEQLIKTSYFDVSADPKIIILTSATDEVSVSFTEFWSSTQAVSSGSKTHTITHRAAFLPPQ